MATTRIDINILTAPKLGEAWPDQGGVLGALMRGQNGAPDYYLILCTDPEAEHEGIEFGGTGKETKGAADEYDGLSNTIALARSRNKHPAAKWAMQQRAGGFDDWYLPSRREIRALWCNVPELFKDGWYWTSTQYSAHYAWGQNFGDGYQSYWNKGNKLRARVVRRLLAY